MTIPVLIGVVGHRVVSHEHHDGLMRELKAAIQDIRRHVPNTQVYIVTSLAEGADRIGALVARELGLEIIVPLPFEVSRYVEDFPNSVEQFEEFVCCAKKAFVVSDGECSGYEAASRWIARHCQVVIAMWDGDVESPAPGGTAQTVLLRSNVGQVGHTLASVADYLGPVLHLHCPRSVQFIRVAPRWIWPIESEVSEIGELFSSLDGFNKEGKRTAGSFIASSLAQIPSVCDDGTGIRKAFAVADCLANKRQVFFNYSVNFSVGLAVVGYVLQQVQPSVEGRVIASLFLTVALLIVFFSSRARNLQKYIEYRALAEVLRIACFLRIAGVSETPANNFLNQHWGKLRWVRGAVNALWMPSFGAHADLDLVKLRWIDDQQKYHQSKREAFSRYADSARSIVNIFFVLSVALAWGAIFFPQLSFSLVLASSVCLVFVGSISHYAHICGWEEHAARYDSMASPFGWCQKIWNHADDKNRLILVRQLGVECVTELSNWLLTHRCRPIGFIKG